MLETESGKITKKMNIPESGIVQIFGQHDKYIKLITAQTGSSISYLGGELTITGGEEAVNQTIAVLSCILELSFERNISQDDIQSTLRMVLNGEVDEIKEVSSARIKVSGSLKYVSPKSKAQKLYFEAIKDNDMIFASGPAGTGKTFIAVAMAVSYYLQKKVQKIVLTRPAVEAGEKLGFLPGDLADKINPYLRPLYDALNACLERELTDKLLERGVIEVAPLAFMRGRTLSNAFVILDEAQNTTSSQMKMFLTRLGFNSKAIITGDPTQTDLTDGITSGLVDAIVRLKSVEGISIVQLSDKDVIRHPLVARIIKAYEG
ncbi:PhoH family protein [Deferribacterales bacterium RsTz2092]|nr:phosphate starvation protein PhoH [Deferribacterales bacterium]